MVSVSSLLCGTVKGILFNPTQQTSLPLKIGISGAGQATNSVAFSLQCSIWALATHGQYLASSIIKSLERNAQKVNTAYLGAVRLGLILF